MSQPAERIRTTLTSLGFEWSTLSATELPHGTLVWLAISPAAQDLAPAALANELLIAETGVVPRLRVRNPTRADILLPSDLVVDGGKQARVLERSVIIEAGAEVEIPVRCVEEGRWQARDAASATRFAVAASATVDSREHLTRLKQDKLRATKTYALGQDDVWSHVAAELDKHGVRSATGSYTTYLSKRELRVEQAKKLAVRPPAEANAVAVLRDGGAAWIEAFPSCDHVAPSVVGIVADLIDEPARDGKRARPFAEPRSRARRILEKLAAAELVAVASPPGTVGTSYAIDADEAAGCLLLRGHRLAHLAATVR